MPFDDLTWFRRNVLVTVLDLVGTGRHEEREEAMIG